MRDLSQRAARLHEERHRSGRAGWLRAAVLGADDGIVSTASLMVGVATASASTSAVVVAGVAGLVAGAMSMAAGEYVSVSSQRDAERADLALERDELESDPEGERVELAAIYRERGLPHDLAQRVAESLMAHDPLGAHARDELGITELSAARPLQAALASAGSFALGAAVPLLALLLVPVGLQDAAVVVSALIALAALGWLGAQAGGAPRTAAAVRVVVGGGAAMTVTALIGRLVGLSGL